MVASVAASCAQPLLLLRVRLDIKAWSSLEGVEPEDELPEGVGDARCLLVEPNGVTRPRDEELPDDCWYPAGDEHETWKWRCAR